MVLSHLAARRPLHPRHVRVPEGLREEKGGQAQDGRSHARGHPLRRRLGQGAGGAGEEERLRGGGQHGVPRQDDQPRRRGGQAQGRRSRRVPAHLVYLGRRALHQDGQDPRVRSADAHRPERGVGGSAVRRGDEQGHRGAHHALALRPRSPGQEAPHPSGQRTVQEAEGQPRRPRHLRGARARPHRLHRARGRHPSWPPMSRPTSS